MKWKTLFREGDAATIDNSEHCRGNRWCVSGKMENVRRRVAFSHFHIFVSHWPTFIPDNIFSPPTRIFFILFKDSRKQAQEASFTYMQSFADDCAPSQLHFWRINKKILFLLPGGEKSEKSLLFPALNKDEDSLDFLFLYFYSIWGCFLTILSSFYLFKMKLNFFSSIFLQFVAEISCLRCKTSSKLLSYAQKRENEQFAHSKSDLSSVAECNSAEFVLESFQLVAVKCTLAAFLLMRGNIEKKEETKWSVISHENWGSNFEGVWR